jgi:4-aminobutyrate aminotransferase/(S)-3-amino-2-methylpropionate transaminase
MRDEVARAWGDPDGEAIHTSTFLGNPLACAAAMASLDVLDAPETRSAIDAMGAALADALDALARDGALGIVQVTHVGLLAGVTVAGGVARSLAVMRTMLERGYVVLPGGVAGDVLTLTPPCTLTAAQLVGFAQALDASLRAVRP